MAFCIAQASAVLQNVGGGKRNDIVATISAVANVVANPAEATSRRIIGRRVLTKLSRQ
jgi:hypothetical protein